MPDGLIQRLLDETCGQVVVMDGGMGSTIADKGGDIHSALWGSYCFLDDQGRCINDQIHSEFVQAGARILCTNTHNARRSKCEEFLQQQDASVLPNDLAAVPPEGRAAALHQWLHDQAVASARRAVPSGASTAIASCLGSIEPLGPYAEESRISSAEACRRLEREWRVRQGSAVDLIIFETLTTHSEIEGIAQLGCENDLGEFAVGLTCGSDSKTLAGVSMAEAVAILGDAKPSVYFVQCTRYDYVHGALRELVSALGQVGVAGVYANDGRVWKDRRWHGERIEPEQYAEAAVTWKQVGARIIGGCCGIGPAHIAKLHKTLGIHG